MRWGMRWAIVLGAALGAAGCPVEEVLNPAPLGEEDASPPIDAGADAEPSDAADASDAAPPECAVDVDCDDKNPCTADACTGGVCLHPPAPAGASCADQDLCNGNESCDGAGVCQPGTPVVIDDGDPCTTDACDAQTGQVTHAKLAACAPTPTSMVGAPTSREHHTAVWTGSKMIVWGGLDGTTGSAVADGAALDPKQNTWSPVSTAGAPPARHSHCAVWTGAKMIVWGGFGTSDYEVTGGVYDPVSDSWTAMSTTAAPSGRTSFACVWSGTQLLVWGGSHGSGTVGTGARYDLASDTWSPISGGAVPTARFGLSGVWSGSSMVVWGGNDAFDWHNDGSIYDPAQSTWTAHTPTLNAPGKREVHTAVWSGSAMLVWGGFNGGDYLDTGGALDLTTGWTALSTDGAPSPRQEHVGLWIGDRMLIITGCGTDSCATVYGDGGLFTPSSTGGSWKPIAADPNLSARRGATGVWTGDSAVIWGGRAGSKATATGALVHP